MKAIFDAFFRAPESAARPAVSMCASPDFERETNRYRTRIVPGHHATNAERVHSLSMQTAKLKVSQVQFGSPDSQSPPWLSRQFIPE